MGVQIWSNYNETVFWKVYTRKWVCKKCKGTGVGSGCWEQGGPIAGLCPECNGHGKGGGKVYRRVRIPKKEAIRLGWRSPAS